MDELLGPLREALDGPIDFHGQRVTDFLSTALLSIFAVVSFLVGYAYEDVFLTLWTMTAGSILTMLAIVPPWPMYNQHPESWLVTGAGGIGRDGIVIDKARG
ncbi:hypothetical protein H112_04410 [Trichophyton rubrum D6]|uniref:Signal peptidase complex subunit 1 n=2 Tax=Trichophyton TaxID=5550 RepID=A0A022W329_TRIRU|nr:hypothetical protein H100_04419 [Trichophyton rubrum MR850]EZF41868.1 hypothetical protein H102_04403 [Trichophyton rubrum CBS 100081]EZF52541.1 hypothetical protein H103_04413 [Trichophyton rubrum CBS 288.86]EZF63030.1 hypothetical protein H104_04401 [Trichophyton rubrum CBS 289.86]EZF73781.1 hypothetical protein H105_04427 [Trichophyton soudanense CBS 452.61]EZF84419.1 hypothetical protein H110_04405 [Trichophyton rubrum MR1448]EZF95130.1 hypothetical protein H113_04446 [Trichophyton rub